jgi:hypothetical protein
MFGRAWGGAFLGSCRLMPRKDKQAHDEDSGRRTVETEAVLVGLGALVGYVLLRQAHLQWPDLHRLVGLALIVVAIGFLAVAAVAAYLWRRRLPRRVNRAFKQLGLSNAGAKRPRLRTVRREGRNVWHLGFRMPVGISSRMLQTTVKLPLEEHLKASVRIDNDGDLTWLHLGTKRLPRSVPFEKFRHEATFRGELPLGIGVSRELALVADLAEMPHLVVGGIAGGGKSVFLRQALTGLATGRSPSAVRLVLADLKGGMEFQVFRDLPHLLAPIADEPASFVQVMEGVHQELARRMDLFRKAGVESLARWNEEHPESGLPYVVICVDELAELTAKTSSQREDGLRGEAVTALSQVARLGRAPGIHLILCTQRPDAEVIPGQIKSNMGAVLAFRAANEIHSQILLGQGDVGSKLLPKDVPGRAIWQGKDGDMQVQPPWLAPDEARRLVAEIKSRWPSESEEAAGEPPREAVSGGLVDKRDMVGRRRSRSKPAFDLTRLKLGNRYEFELGDGTSVIGVLRRLDYPRGLGGENADGQHPVQVTDGAVERFLNPKEIVGARKCVGDAA